VTHPLPHVERHRVALCRIVEGDDSDAILDPLEDLAVGIGFVGFAGGI